MVVGDQWLRRAGRPGPTPGVRELEADDQTVVAADGRDVGADEIGTQRREVVDGRAVEDELARVGAPVAPHGDGFATPDELRSALAEPAPAAAHEVRGVVRRPRRPTLPWAAPRTGCPRCARRSSRRRRRRGCTGVRADPRRRRRRVGRRCRAPRAAPRSSSIVRRRFTWTISLPVTATPPSAARCRRAPRGRCRDVGVRRAASCPTRCDHDAAGTAPRRVGTRGPVPGTRTRRGTGGGR